MEARVPGIGSDLNRAMVFLHDSLHGVEAETGSFPDGLGGEEGFEDVILDLGRNAGSVISNLNHGTAIVAIGSNSKLALSRHGIDRIVD